MEKKIRVEESYLEFWSKDNNFGLRIPKKQIESMLNHCYKSSPNETGGIFIGSYTKSLDCAVIEKVTGPPKDSKHGISWFKRGVKGLQKILDLYWNKKYHYIGEWHFHPNGEPFPSNKDMSQLVKISKSKDYDCSSPILVIIGGSLPSNWSVRSFVFPKDTKFQELFS